MLLAAVLAASPAYASNAQEDSAPAGPDRSGFRIEALIGSDTDGFESGLLMGGRIGYDFRVGANVLLGIDAELSDVTTDQEFPLPAPASTFVLEDGPDTYVGARATVLLSRRFSLHGGAGYTRARQSFFFLADPGPPLVVGGEQSFQDGFRLTAGGQFSIGRRAFIGLEYRYSDYSRGFQRGQLAASVGLRF
jgi:outer membrane immunogenic protein